MVTGVDAFRFAAHNVGLEMITKFRERDNAQLSLRLFMKNS